MSEASPGALARGRRLGDYEIEACVGTGGMGSVYRAHHVETGATVALKRLHDSSQTARFEIEARLMSHLRHPRVARIVDHFPDPEQGYTLAFEFVDGSDFARMLWDRGTPGLPVLEVLERARELCEALAYVHSQQIVHADVKPSNLMCGREGSVLVDFGLAARFGAADADLTSSGGTKRFMAPEVFAGDPPSPRSDVYGLAASLWAMLTGSPPVYGDDTSLTHLVVGVSHELEQALRSALELRPENRVRSADEFAQSIGEPLREGRGASLGVSVADLGDRGELVEAVARTAAGVFEAASASIALIRPETGELEYVAAWGVAAQDVVGLRLSRGVGIVGSVVESGEPQAVPSCRADPRFAAEVAAAIGYVPNTMLVVPLRRDAQAIGALQIVDRRNGEPYGDVDLARSLLFGELAVAVLA